MAEGAPLPEAGEPDAVATAGSIPPAPWQPTAALAAIALVGVALSSFQLWSAGVQPLGLFYQRSIHLGFVLALAFLMFPVFGPRPRGPLGWAIDVAWLAAAVLSGGYIAVFLDDIVARAGFWSRTDITVGIVATVTVLEASRRAVGWGLTAMGVVAILYALAGPRGALPWLGEWMPGVLAHRGYSVDRLIGTLYLGQEGIFGLPLGVAATYIFIFVLFGAFLEVTGAGRFFIDLAYAATGRKRGGPAKAAVIASAGMGSISGSAIANVVTTGAFTIPLMKRLGYGRAQAGGIEAAASTGGQIMPPLMGAGAFLLSEYTRVPYLEIVKVSIFPAILYFGTVYLFVHIAALKRGLEGAPAEDLPRTRDVLRAGWPYLVPLGVLVWLLALSVSPMRVGFYAIVTMLAMAAARALVAALVRGGGPASGGVEPPSAGVGGGAAAAGLLRAGLAALLRGLELGARNAVPVSLACAVAGIIVGVVGLTGLGLKFSAMMIALSGGNIVLALLLVIVASLILGMGLPVTAAYIVLIVLVGPALTAEFGIPLLIAHLVVFWYSQDSNVTPPVALAAFAGAAIAGARPMETAFQAWKYAKGLYLIPAFMVFNPEIILGGPVVYVLFTGAAAMLALAAFAGALEGHLFAPMGPVARLLVVPGVVAVFWPSLAAEIAGVALLAAVAAANWAAARRAAARTA